MHGEPGESIGRIDPEIVDIISSGHELAAEHVAWDGREIIERIRDTQATGSRLGKLVADTIIGLGITTRTIRDPNGRGFLGMETAIAIGEGGPPEARVIQSSTLWTPPFPNDRHHDRQLGYDPHLIIGETTSPKTGEINLMLASLSNPSEVRQLRRLRPRLYSPARETAESNTCKPFSEIAIRNMHAGGILSLRSSTPGSMVLQPRRPPIWGRRAMIDSERVLPVYGRGSILSQPTNEIPEDVFQMYGVLRKLTWIVGQIQASREV